MVSLMDIHWYSGNVFHKQEVSYVILVEAYMGGDKACLGYTHWEKRLLGQKE